MADNVTLSEGAVSPPDGTVIATDDVGSAHYQYVKLTFGADGTATKVSSADPLPVDTELAAAVAAGDSMSAPTTAPVLAHLVGWDGSNTAARRVRFADSDGVPQTSTLLMVPGLFNPAGVVERSRPNYGTSLLASAARTSDTTSSDQTARNERAVQVVLNLTAFTTAASLTLTIQGKDPVSGTYYDLDTGVAVTATGIYVYELGLGVGAASGGVTRRTGGVLPRTFRVKVAHGNANSHTYSVGIFTNV